MLGWAGMRKAKLEALEKTFRKRRRPVGARYRFIIIIIALIVGWARFHPYMRDDDDMILVPPPLVLTLR